VFLFLVGMLEEFIGGCARFEAGRHVVVALVAQVANQFRCQCFVEQANHHIAVGGVGFGDCTVLHMLARTFAQGLLVAQLYVAHQALLELCGLCSAVEAR